MEKAHRFLGCRHTHHFCSHSGHNEGKMQSLAGQLLSRVTLYYGGKAWMLTAISAPPNISINLRRLVLGLYFKAQVTVCLY